VAIRRIWIARNGETTGDYDAAKLPDLIADGTVKSTDHFFVEGAKSWRLVSEYKPEEETSPARTASVSTERAGSASRESRRSTPPAHSYRPHRDASWLPVAVLSVVCTVLLVALIFAFVWLRGENEELRVLSRERADALRVMEKELAQAKLDAYPMKRVGEGKLEGRVFYRTAGQAYAFQGVQVGLYPASTVDAAIEATRSSPDFSPQAILAALPGSGMTTVTDSDGFFKFDLPAAIENMVLTCRATVDGSGGRQTFYWLVTLSRERAAERPVLLNETNESRWSESTGFLRSAD